MKHQIVIALTLIHIVLVIISPNVEDIEFCAVKLGRPIWQINLGLEEGRKNSLYYSIVYYYNGAQRYEQFLQVSRLYRALILLGLTLSSEHLCVFGLHGAICILKICLLTSFSYLR